MSILRSVLFLLMLITELLGKNPVNEKLLRVTISEYPIVAEEVVFNANGDLIRMDGMGVNYLKWLSQRFHYPYSVTKFYGRTDGSLPIGTFNNGSWDGMMGDITQDVADLAVGAFGARFTYIPYAEMTFPWAQGYFSLYIPFPEGNISIWAFFKPFTLIVWILLVVSFIIVAYVIYKLQSISPGGTTENDKRRSFTYGTVLLYLLAVMSGQGGCWNYKGKALVILGTTWCLTSVVIVNGYNGLLMSYLSTISREPLVTSLEDLAAKPSVKFYSYKNSYVIFTFAASQAGAKKALGQVLLSRPQLILPDIKDCLQVVQDGIGACLMESATGDRFIQQKLNETGKCVATSVAKRFLEFNPVFLMPKNSSFFPRINSGMIWLAAMGFQPHWHEKYRPKVPECDLVKSKSSTAQKLMLSSFYGPFVMLFVGYFMAAVAFCGETVAYRRLNQKRSTSTSSRTFA